MQTSPALSTVLFAGPVDFITVSKATAMWRAVAPRVTQSTMRPGSVVIWNCVASSEISFTQAI